VSLSDAAVGRLRATLEEPDAGARYEVGTLLGRGGMGAVYAARDRVLGRDVAIKVLALAADGPGDGERLAREARLLARLEHPGIVTVHDVGTLADGRPFYVMRLVRGVRLDQYAERETRGELLRIFLRVCDAVAFAHARGIVHRDLKPGNIMVGEFGEALVLDWGIARSLGEPAADAVAGTPGFMAPEQAAGLAGPPDARTDVFGLGAILRELLRRSPDAAPRPLLAIIARATAFDPARRYPGAERLAEDLRRWLDGEKVEAHHETPVEMALRIYRRHQVLILLLLAYAVVRITILLWRGV
jgi:serine/threonine protein kinase